MMILYSPCASRQHILLLQYIATVLIATPETAIIFFSGIGNCGQVWIKWRHSVGVCARSLFVGNAKTMANTWKLHVLASPESKPPSVS